ncbi:hypothetical protein [Streptomyces sp. NPDC052042]|uniref:hypothetical protein n=1 Tax=Streptomyces sp. NPDC052042 TaxID=3365683 RepID=UPI0037CCDC86
MTDSTTPALSARITGWIRAHPKTVFVLRHVGVYGLAIIWALVKATLIAVLVGVIASVAQLVIIATAYQALMPEKSVDDIVEPSAGPVIFVAAIAWIVAVLSHAWHAGRGVRRFSVRTLYGSTEYAEWRNATSRARELVAQAVVTRSSGIPVHSITLPPGGIGHVNYSYFSSRPDTWRERMVAACALSIAGDALHQDHAVLDWAIVNDATAEAPAGFTRDEIIREAALAVADALRNADGDVREPIERELRYVGRIDGGRLEGLLTEAGVPALSTQDQTVMSAQASAIPEFRNEKTPPMSTCSPAGSPQKKNDSTGATESIRFASQHARIEAYERFSSSCRSARRMPEEEQERPWHGDSGACSTTNSTARSIPWPRI